MRLPLYFDNGTEFVDVANYISAEFSTGFWRDNKYVKAGANKFIVKTTMDDPAYTNGSGRFVPQSESPMEYFSRNYFRYDFDFTKREATYYGFTERNNIQGYTKFELGGHNVQRYDYTAENRSVDVSGLIDSGYGVIYAYDNIVSASDAPGTPRSKCVITFYEPELPWDELEWNIGDNITLNDDVYIGGWYRVGKLVEKRLIMEKDTWRTEFTICSPEETQMFKLPAGSSDYDCFARWSHSSNMWIASPLYD